ncbi:MAG: hypothetical protein ACK4TP_05500 [Hyphomicrobium sp.]
MEENYQYLHKRYLRLMRWSYCVPESAISDQLGPDLGATQYSNLADLEKLMSDAALRRQGRARFYNGYWRLLLREAIEAVPRQTRLRETAIYIGEVPDPRFNAKIMTVFKSGEFQGYLLLVNRGLEMFLYRVACILVGAMKLKFEGSTPEPSSKTTDFAPEFDVSDAKARIQRNIELLARYQHEMPAALGPQHAMVAATYAYAMQQYVVGHELGHVLCDMNRQHLTNVTTDREEEFFADEMAGIFCHELIDCLTQQGTPSKLAERAMFEAPFIIFPILGAVDDLMPKHTNRPRLTHPPPSERTEQHLARLQRSNIDDFYVELARQRIEQMREFTTAEAPPVRGAN